MNFRTDLTISPQEPKIELTSQLLSLGSCFSDSIGEKLALNKFKANYNPFGVLFNPISIFKLLELAIKQEQPNPHHYIEQEGLWKHFDFHSQFSLESKDELQVLLNLTLNRVREYLANTDVLILTFGTAWVHQLQETNEIVANCHKVPNAQFTKRLLELSELEKGFDSLVAILPKKIRILLTVSPIRHIKEGLTLNQVSKSILRLFCHHAVEHHQQVSYFPSYELLLDDLRDYRFYKDDLIHPSDFAISYIWEKFMLAHFSEESQAFVKKWKKILLELQHKALHPESVAHQAFLKKLYQKLCDLPTHIDVNQELEFVSQQLLDNKD